MVQRRLWLQGQHRYHEGRQRRKLNRANKGRVLVLAVPLPSPDQTQRGLSRWFDNFDYRRHWQTLEPGVHYRVMRVNSRLKGLLLLCSALALVLSSFLHLYYVGSSGDGDLLWNQSRAYLFVRGEHRGYRISYLGYIATLIKEYFGIVDEPDERRPYTLVVMIDSTGVHRFEERQTFERFTPVNQDIYARHDIMLWRWTGTNFVQAAEQEQRQVDTGHFRDFTDLNGWSRRRLITTPVKRDFDLQLDGAPARIKTRTVNLYDGEVTIDLSRPNRASETIFHNSGRPRRVSKHEYERLFG